MTDEPSGARVRLHKLLAERGIASRRAAEQMIVAGRVTVNDRVVTTLGVTVDPANDRVRVDGKPLPSPSAPRVFLLHKPVGYLCTCHPSRELGPTILELLPADGRYYPVGRLDRDSSGLLIVTDDGDLANRLTHPRYGSRKVYSVKTSFALDAEQMAALRRGVVLEDGLAKPVSLRRTGNVTVELTLSEGRNRQIRRMIQTVGAHVRALQRIRIGNLELGDLPPGGWRELASEEIESLRGARTIVGE